MLLGSCSVGHGDGEVDGVVSIDGCRREGPYQLRPTVFFAETVEQVLKIRIQRGSDIEVYSDGIGVLVDDAALVRRAYLGQAIEVAAPLDGPAERDVPHVDVTLFLNESCPAERTRTPVTLSAVSGTIRFAAIYAPKVDKDDVRIAAELENVRFEDPRVDDRWAVLNGRFDFLYVRGSPAQRFP
ncbi:MAG TPA: hypothetical protein VFX59_19600 [Polyangiales bacterium]|nr:hypothetical protein [Polyangiales bacterium]